MSARVYRVVEGEWEELPERTGGRRYVMQNHPETGEVCYRECTDEEDAKHAEQVKQFEATRRRERPKSLRELVTELQTRIAELEKRG